MSHELALKLSAIGLHMQVNSTTHMLDLMVTKGLITPMEASGIVLKILDDFNDDVSKLGDGVDLSGIKRWLEDWVTALAKRSKSQN